VDAQSKAGSLAALEEDSAAADTQKQQLLDLLDLVALLPLVVQADSVAVDSEADSMEAAAVEALEVVLMVAVEVASVVEEVVSDIKATAVSSPEPVAGTVGIVAVSLLQMPRLDLEEDVEGMAVVGMVVVEATAVQVLQIATAQVLRIATDQVQFQLQHQGQVVGMTHVVVVAHMMTETADIVAAVIEATVIVVEILEPAAAAAIWSR
jgi:hypothetical protein